MYEDDRCVDCELHRKAKHRCLPSWGTPDLCKLAIYLDHPSAVEDKRGRSFVSDNADFVQFCLRRMSVNIEEVYLDYILKCYPIKLPGKKPDRMACVSACAQYRLASLEDLPHLRAVVGLGSLACETFTGVKEIGLKAGVSWEPISPIMRQLCPTIWIGYSPGSVREKPSEAGAIYRVIFRAAEQAGLNPKPNLSIKPYEFVI